MGEAGIKLRHMGGGEEEQGNQKEKLWPQAMRCLDLGKLSQAGRYLKEKASTSIKGNLPVVTDQPNSLGQNSRAQDGWAQCELST